MLDIQAVNADGTLEAVYLNPRPIHVAKAAAARDGAALLVRVELRDMNYPGSTYRLTYDAEGDQLNGDYFQAVAKEHFDVAFKRMK
ncbi:MAG: hypothetical protein K8T25_19500 [Planctomycetia bacterium]|nr:hypothetical protein [Planctomycetia bacterium]